MDIRWGLIWWGNCLISGFYEGLDEPQGIVWSMGIAYDTIMNLGEMKLVDTREEERIMNLKGGENDE